MRMTTKEMDGIYKNGVKERREREGGRMEVKEEERSRRRREGNEKKIKDKKSLLLSVRFSVRMNVDVVVHPLNGSGATEY